MTHIASRNRSLILAGGGMKVAFQAGVLEVWLDEAGLSFDHVDAASGGVFNLAMLCQGMSGRQIADNWRNLNPVAGISFNALEFSKLLYAESLFTLDNYRERVFPQWGLNWEKIRSTNLDATFNVFNFSTKKLEVIPAKGMNEDLFVACVSLPMWFPPVRIGGQIYIDSVYLTDANIEEAIRHGADDLWTIWTVSDKNEWQPGFIATYFQIIETTANGHYKSILNRLAESNNAIAAGKNGEFGRQIEVKELKAEVPLHYLINFSKDRVMEAVNSGVKYARGWCRDQGIPLKNQGQEYPIDIHSAHTSLSFTEEMKGFVTPDEMDYEKGYSEGKKRNNKLMFHLTITVDGVNRFISRPEHDAEAAGWIQSDMLGGKLPVSKGAFNLFVDDKDPAVKNMLYRLFFRNAKGEPLTLSGFKVIRDDPSIDVWTDTTTLFTRIYRGHISSEQEGTIDHSVIASGILRIHLMDFMKQLTTFRVQGPTVSDKATALSRFGKLFFGKLWDVYAREILTYSPF